MTLELAVVSSIERKESVREHVVGHLATLRNSCGAVEPPINAEVDPALAVFLLGL
jgi:hypothetical protein